MSTKSVKFDSFSIKSECMGREDCIDPGILRRVVHNIESTPHSYQDLLDGAFKVTHCKEG